MSKRNKWILIGVIIVFILGMALFPTIKKKYASSNKISSKEIPTVGKGSQKRDLNVNVMVMKYENLSDNFRTTGSLVPDEDVDLSFEASGKITNINFEEGSHVRKGQLLAKVNDRPLQAELKKLQAQIPLATDRVYRQKTLLAKDAVSQEAYEQVSTELEKLNADIELIKARIIETELIAPFDGVIGLRQVSEGAYATPSTIVAKLTKIIPLKIEFSINEKQANEVSKGTPLSFKVEGDLNQYGATVYAVEPQLDTKTRTMKAKAIYPNSNGKLQPGRTAAIELRLKEIKDALTIPSEAIIAEMGKDIVYIYKGGKAQGVAVEKGLRTASKIQIVEGVSPGDTLIVTGVMQLRDGMPVKIDQVLEW